MAIGGTSSWALEIDQCRAKHWEIPLNSFDDPKILHEIDRDIGKYDAGHRGVDLKGNVGDVIHAPESGKILWKGVVGGKPTFTYQVDDLKLTFTPASTARSVGESVRKGEALGTLTQNNDGSNHCIDSVCLHWGVVDDQDNYLDPKAFVYRPRIVLKRILG
jgi:murein DD-endopeptidase MepM/ murein hydrolase activator NlpD